MSIGLLVLICLCGLFCVLYAFELSKIISQLKVELRNVSISERINKSVSIVVACRNEEVYLAGLLNSFSAQNYPLENLEYIIIDDNSEDKSLEILTQWQTLHPELTIKIERLTEGMGKKSALKLGISQSTSEFILCTDADCFMGKDWVSCMMNYQAENQKELVLGPVNLQAGTEFFSQFQCIETLGLQSVTAGTANKAKAVMGNGANLLFRRESYLLLQQDDLSPSFASGDDVFLVHEFKKKFGGNSIGYNSQNEAVVTTYPQVDLRSFYWQHIRWASKSKAYSDAYSIYLGSITAMMNSGIVFLTLSCWGNATIKVLLIGVLLFKGLIEYLLIRKMKSIVNQQIKFLYYILSVVIYPFFSLSILLTSLSGKYYWKGRKVK